MADISAIGKDKYISIHAPPRGATFRDVRESGRRENFNSRPSARGDRFRLSSVGELKNFNSRPSARGDSESKTA